MLGLVLEVERDSAVEGLWTGEVPGGGILVESFVVGNSEMEELVAGVMEDRD
jgi:hypothetical protein